MKKTLYTTTYFRALVLLAMAVVLTGCAVPRTSGPQKDYALTVLHTNDVHSSYGGFTSENRICYAPVCEGGSGGSVRLQRAVRAVRAQKPDAILLDGGDEFQGTLFWTLHKAAPITEIIDRIGYQAIAPGNHEFDDGVVTFLCYANSIKTPVVAANLSFDKGLKGAERILPWLVTEIKGRKVGIVGLVTAETPLVTSNSEGAKFSDEAAALKKAVTELTAQGVDIIIALTHDGFEDDKKLARTVAGVDIFVGGHSHSLLSNSIPRAEGKYPTVEKSPEGKPVLVVSAGSAGRYLGKLDVVFDAAGVPVSWSGEPIPVDDKTLAEMKAPEADAALAAVIEKYAAPAREKMVSKLGEIVAPGLDGLPLEKPDVLQCRANDCLTGNIVADALLTIPFKNTQVALLNGGALRNSLPGGKVTAGDVLATLPFQNTPVTADVPGSVILQALEHGVSAYGDGSGGFLQTAGLRYAFDDRRPKGQRITKAEVRDANGKWKAVAKAKNYRVVTIDFLSNGTDGFAVLKPFNWREAQGLMSDAVRVYLEQKSPVSVKPEGRIMRIK
ncbi:MAG: bifunctional metallophosphatase/5'-nucleotidase [Desulfovibrio sp.]|jgi:5'-nucleotidase|nr:bifunctional metallophosphatase/5'-nucleotidase [Desulfovibrio sp.]